MEIYENRNIEFEYFNEKKLSVHDFLKSIKTDLANNISKNIGFIDKYNEVIYFEISYINKNDDVSSFSFSDNIKNFYVDGICTDKFAKDLIYYANRKENYDYGMELFYGDGDLFDYYDYDEDDDEQIEYNINNFIIDSFYVTIYMDVYKILHKNKFYKDLYDDLMPVAWHPSRYLEWCVDIEGVKVFERVMGRRLIVSHYVV